MAKPEIEPRDSNLIKKIVKFKHINQAKLADKLEVKKQRISSVIRCQEYLGNNLLDKIEKLYPDIYKFYPNRLDELDKIYDDSLKIVSKVQETEDIVVIDDYPDVYGSCGNGVFVPSEYKIVMKIPQSIIPRYSSYKQYARIIAKGESMKPDIKNGDKLILEVADSAHIEDNKVYAFCYRDEFYVKRLVKNIDEIAVISDNPDKATYRTRLIEKEDMNDITILGKVVALMREV
jgi:phage repressor protein C with HTH and peptisase S24 domain